MNTSTIDMTVFDTDFKAIASGNLASRIKAGDMTPAHPTAMPVLAAALAVGVTEDTLEVYTEYFVKNFAASPIALAVFLTSLAYNPHKVDVACHNRKFVAACAAIGSHF